MINIGAIIASQTAMRVAAMNAMKKNLENQKKAIDKQHQVCYTNTVERDKSPARKEVTP